MIRAHTVAAVRRAEEAAIRAVGEDRLMQRAAAGLAHQVAHLLRERHGGVAGRRVVLLVGGGSNGGDAMWAGARLARRGASVTAVPASDRLHPAGLAGLLAGGGRLAERDQVSVLARADVVVDGLLGIGGRAGLRAAAAGLVAAVPRSATVVAVDLPSGVDPDSGEVPPAGETGSHVVADLTVTFGTAKPCLLVPPAAHAAGAVRVVDIGLDPRRLGVAAVERLEPADAGSLWPVPGPLDDKYSRGVVGVVAGGAAYPGAAVLCAGAAVRQGAGMVRYVGPERAADVVRTRWPEVVAGSGRVQAWALGSGVDPDDARQADAVRDALASDLPCVVDAGALGLLPPCGRPAPTLLTPHAGELARLLGRQGQVRRADVESRPLHHARRAAAETGATVLLKGAVTLVVPPDGPARAQPAGPPWLATAGAGDVLAGACGVLLAAGLDPVDAGALAVVVHATAAGIASAGGPISAGSVLDALPAATARLLRTAQGRLGD